MKSLQALKTFRDMALMLALVVLGLAAGLSSTSCKHVEKVGKIALEAAKGADFCIIHEKYGKVCFSIDGVRYYRHDLGVTPEEREEIEAFVQSELKKRSSF